jgi:Tfp pilus assembly protein PilF
MNQVTSLIAVAAIAVAALATAVGCSKKPDSAHAPAAIEAVNRGVSLMGQYDYDGAARAFEAALAVEPGSAEIQVNLAIARFNRGKKELQDIEQGTALLEAVLAREPGNLRAWYFKGIVLQHQGDAAAAIPCFEKVLAARPDDGAAWYILGMCKQRVGQDPERELLRAIELRPYLVSAYYRLWQTLQAAGQTERAAPYLEQFKKLREHPLAETIELPQYNQMGDLALVVPLPGTPAPVHTPPVYRAGTPRELLRAEKVDTSATFGSAAFADIDRDGRVEALACGWATTPGPVAFWKVDTGAPAAAQLGAIASPLACAIGDYDNDETPDLFVVTGTGNHLFRGSPDATFAATTAILPAAAAAGPTRSALWFDADHDGDLDLLLGHRDGTLQLIRNNADGTFTDISESLGETAAGGDTVLALPGDIDGDRDTDLVLLRADAPARILLNDLAGRFRPAPGDASAIRGDLGGALQDFDGDGHLDLLTLRDHPAVPALHLGDGRGGFRASPTFGNTATAAAVFGVLKGLRAVDIDLDGDLDIAVLGEEGHVLLNDGAGHFTLQGRVWAPTAGARLAAAELADLTGDLVPDLLVVEQGEEGRLVLIPGTIDPAPTALAISPSGVRSRDKRTRSPASGYGVELTMRAGLREQTRLVTGQTGGLNQSPLPVVFGLAGSPRADYVRLDWPDGVAQIESDLPAGRAHAVAETQRKVSSCPVLFTWNGERFEFITDFAGVGGLGYFVGGGQYAMPTPVDHVKIEPHQLRAIEGRYELRITEPMEETAYVDRLELVAIDHPASWQVHPDERLAVAGPPPTRELLVVREPIFAERAITPAGAECAAALRQADRHYAFEPELDRRFIGFCVPHTLELDFGTQLASVAAGERVFLFINGYLEYPYSQTTYAAEQAQVAWQPIRIDRQQPDGTWQTIVPDAGAFGGMARTMTTDLTGLAGGGSCRLRLTSNLEMFYDQIFVARVSGAESVAVHRLAPAEAELRYVGIAREVSPDGRFPLVYDYQQTDVDVPFRSLSGAYTRYGPVRELLAEADDLFVLVATGDEIAASFDATALPTLAPGFARSFVLVSHAYCKDMDRYTATPETLEPMPFSGMSRYPYPASERPAETEAQRRVRESYNTRIVK